MKLLSLIIALLLPVICANAQTHENKREDEIALGIKVVTGEIKYGSSDLYATDVGSVSIQPGVRYDYPVKISGKHKKEKYISLSGHAGFLFCKAKNFDILYFDPKNPAYFTLHAGVYNRTTFSVGSEIFFWKGLGNRDLFGAKFLSAGYNGKNFRIYACGEFYSQVINTGNTGLLFSVDFFWKLIKGN